MLAGCGAPAATSSKQPVEKARVMTRSADAAPTKLTLSDPCASRLHDLCGPLLYYLSRNYRLPETLDELRQMPGLEGVGEFVCPDTKQPYIYNPAGVVGPNVSQRAVVYDAEPTHRGHRWTIIIKEATPNAPFTAEVVAWPESRFPKAAPK